MKHTAVLTGGVALALTGCSVGGGDGMLQTYGLADMDAVEIVDHLDRLPVAERPDDLLASVQPNELILATAQDEITLPLPEDLTYVSVAPYATYTHDCFYHSLTTCLGELDNEPVRVTFTDGASGETLIDEQVTTFDNGFAGFWVPADVSGTIVITHRDRVGATEFSTAEDGATCVTDLQLT